MPNFTPIEEGWWVWEAQVFQNHLGFIFQSPYRSSKSLLWYSTPQVHFPMSNFPLIGEGAPEFKI